MHNDNLAIFLFGIILFAAFTSLVAWILFGPEEFKPIKRKEKEDN
jgi:hypothetical protein